MHRYSHQLKVVQSVRPSGGAHPTTGRVKHSESSATPPAYRTLGSRSAVVNYGIRPDENTCPAGALIRDANVSVSVDVQDLLRTHFGIFGFTGAGKSNLVSTLVESVLQHSREPVKIVLFDLMSEYSTLLIDRLASRSQDGMLIALGEETLPASIVEYFSLAEGVERQQREQALARAAQDLVNTTLLPPALVDLRPQFELPMRALLMRNKIRIWRKRALTVDAYLVQTRNEIKWGGMGLCAGAVHGFIDQLQTNFQGQGFTEVIVDTLVQRINAVTTTPTIDGHKLTESARTHLSELRNQIQQDGPGFVNLRPIPTGLRINIPELVERLNERTASGLFIIQAHDPDELRHFAATLGDIIYDSRRTSAQISPLVSFIFDEADEFIPLQAQDTYLESSRIAMTLARRGRKFGLGLGIATQRVTYLNTSIMAQPHTYFVSKMPRQSDRQRVSEAFGASEDIFRQTFKFKKGDWLLMSHDATGLDAIPIPIHTADANARIRRALNEAQARAAERSRN